jgi:hypothetical protein
MKENNVIELMNNGEQVPVSMMQRVFRNTVDVRIAIATHPVTKEVAPCVPYKDFADAFSYDHEGIRQMIQRSRWLKKHSVTCMMQATDGKYYSTLCMFEECALGIFMKLQPERCKDKDVSQRIEELQEEMVYFLRDGFKQYKSSAGDDARVKSFFLRVRTEKEIINLMDKVRSMPIGEYKTVAIDRLGSLTGRKFPRAIQGELQFGKKEE